uniref:DUF255 domain-containing protein n=1 Tax=Desulfobacca acetoxidans TaxID=60893 RepID=A0A7V6DQF2_9BACT
MSELINWRSDLPEAKEEARRTRRPLLLEIYLEGCPHCLRLALETHQNPAVVEALNNRFLPVRLEGRGHMDVVRELQVTGAPTTIIFSPDGQETRRLVGFYAPEEYLRELERKG